MDITICDKRVSTGIAGLDEILGGGLTADRIYLVEGAPGSGKTTMGLQFLLEGARRGERTLYVTLSETADELRAVAASHGWSLDAVEIFELLEIGALDPDGEQSILHPSEIELGETTRAVMERITRNRPTRVAFDSLSEMRLLAQNPLRYRRQIMSLKHFFGTVNCTVLLLDDQTSEVGDLQLRSICHGVIELDQTIQNFGGQRRRLQIVKMRGISYRGGYHDFNLETGGVTVFQRLVASDHRRDFAATFITTGNSEMDRLLGGGLTPGTNTLLIGPSGVGKTTTAIRVALSALQRGETVAYYLFDEGLGTLISRSAALGLGLADYMQSGQMMLWQIDPAELSPGEFAAKVRSAVETKLAKVVVIDSLNAYLHAMPGEKYLLLQMHELLTYLNQQGVITILVLGQHGLIGEMRNDVDLSYLSDTIMLFRFFESGGQLRTALSVVKSRTAAHEHAIREFRLTPQGMEVGEPLTDFEGVLTGVPTYRGRVPLLGTES
jgi:circadian clock protein KaiC